MIDQQKGSYYVPESSGSTDGPNRTQSGKAAISKAPGAGIYRSAPDKPPKEYPDMEMKFGQSNSKKIKYINYDGVKKTIHVVSSDPNILNVKTPTLQVDGYNSEYIRLRFVAPKTPGKYTVTIEIRADGDSIPEEILKFPITSS